MDENTLYGTFWISLSAAIIAIVIGTTIYNTAVDTAAINAGLQWKGKVTSEQCGGWVK